MWPRPVDRAEAVIFVVKSGHLCCGQSMQVLAGTREILEFTDI